MPYKYPEEMYYREWVDIHGAVYREMASNLDGLVEHSEKEYALYKLVKIVKAKIESKVIVRDV